MSTRVREWRIHFGAHKTATTHFQTVLEHYRASLADKGIDVIPKTQFRETILPWFHRRFVRKRAWRALMGNSILSWELRRKIEPIRQNKEIVLISEENLPGYIADIFSPKTYPRLEDCCHALSSLAYGSELTLFFSIRSFDRVIPGAYATKLQFPGRDARTVEDFSAQWRRTPQSWVQVVDRIRAAVPRANLRIWTQAEYKRNPELILSEFTGTSFNSIVDIPPPVRTITPTEVAIREAEALIAEGLRANDHQRKIEAIYAENLPGPNKPRYMPFTDRECSKMQQNFERDLDQIRNKYPGMLIEFS